MKTEGERSVLLYASCLGGDRQIVAKFLSPGMDVNHSVQYVRQFEGYDKLTPLFAACSGKYFYVR